jgi:hypothetical protein
MALAVIVGLSGMSIGRDGTGGLVYMKDVAGVAHVFVSRVVGGFLEPPEEVDSVLGGPSSQPVTAAGNGGLLSAGTGVTSRSRATCSCSTYPARPVTGSSGSSQSATARRCGSNGRELGTHTGA